LSRLPGKRARPVLRGPGRSNAPRLPDWRPVFYLLEAHGLVRGSFGPPEPIRQLRDLKLVRSGHGPAVPVVSQ